MQVWVSMFPESGASGIPDDSVSRNPEGGVIVFSLGGTALLKKKKKKKKGCCHIEVGPGTQELSSHFPTSLPRPLTSDFPQSSHS